MKEIEMAGDVGEWTRDEYVISTDRSRLDIGAIHRFLRDSYWAAGIPIEIVERSVQHSITFGVFKGTELVGFARVISDCATFGYLADVFVLPSHRCRGLSKWLIQVILRHPDLQGFRLWLLATRDAHGLYGRFGFKTPERLDRYMEIRQPNAYIGRDSGE
jgi:GNAT superfamily N-acetyltransferase